MSHKSAQRDYKSWKDGNLPGLDRQECIELHCYECNGFEDVYCGGRESCILYQYSQYNFDDEMEK